jgi:hypothetical protein
MKRMTVLAALAAMTSLSLQPAWADARSNARNFCENYKRTSGGNCVVEKCPCGIGLKRIKKFKRGGLRIGICVCEARSDQRERNRRLAQAACNEFTALHRRPCWVVKNHCGVTRMPVKKFGNGPLVRYSACREKHGAERLKKAADKLAPVLAPHTAFFISQYRKYMGNISAVADRPTVLPASTRQRLQRYFTLSDLSKVRIAFSPSALVGAPPPVSACITDCTTIYCRDHSFVARVRSGEISNLLIHEIAHTQQCARWGGRNQYAMQWFRNVPRGLIDAASAKGASPGGSTSFGTRFHDGMPMEQEAFGVAGRTCATLGPAICR